MSRLYEDGLESKSKASSRQGEALIVLFKFTLSSLGARTYFKM
jgi:hypothetical protein